MAATAQEQPQTPAGRSDKWLTRKQAAQFLTNGGAGVSPQQLARMAERGNAGGGPPFTRTCRRIVRYHLDDLRTWANENVRIVR